MTIHVKINELVGVALVDTGSSINAISPAFACVAGAEAFPLEKPIGLQLGCVGSRSKINYGMSRSVELGGQLTKTMYLDVVNLDHYDVVLGIPFLRMNGVTVNFKENTLQVGDTAIPTLRKEESFASMAGTPPRSLSMNDVPRLRERWLTEYADMLAGVPERLPPMREINHRIPIIDEKHTYRYHHPRCSDALKPKLLEKIERYTRSGWWTFKNVPQAAPMMCLPKRDGG
ncbi:hypothetical protein BC629DRAFT_1287372, partial [Irpex lacteus]